jgi:hypothetical protein
MLQTPHARETVRDLPCPIALGPAVRRLLGANGYPVVTLNLIEACEKSDKVGGQVRTMIRDESELSVREAPMGASSE